MTTTRYIPELARQRCPECRNALALTPFTRIAGTVRVRQHVCPVKGCGCRWHSHEAITEPVTVTTLPNEKPLVPQAKARRRR